MVFIQTYNYYYAFQIKNQVTQQLVSLLQIILSVAEKHIFITMNYSLGILGKMLHEKYFNLCQDYSVYNFYEDNCLYLYTCVNFGGRTTLKLVNTL